MAIAFYTSYKITKAQIIDSHNFKYCSYFTYYQVVNAAFYTASNPKKSIKRGAKLKHR